MLSTREKLLANFDDEVIDKLKLRLAESKAYITKYEKWLWTITKHELGSNANFNDEELTFRLTVQPNKKHTFPTETFKLGKPSTQPHIYRMGHPLAQYVLESVKQHATPNANLTFDLTQYEGNITILEELKGQSGWMTVTAVSVNSFESSDYLLIYGNTSEAKHVTEEQLKQMLTLPVTKYELASNEVQSDTNEKLGETHLTALLKSISENDSFFMKLETEKLNKWAEDRINASELAIKETKAKIKELNRESHKTTVPAEQLKIQEELQELSRKQKKQRQEIFIVEDEIAEMRDKMIADIQHRMKQEITKEHLFTINWKLI